jgi:flagellar protein FlgJ
MIEASRFKKLREPPTPEQQDKKLRQVGELYEKQFLREMVKAMRSTVHESGFIKSSQAENIFKEQLDQEYVENWGAKGGVGMSDLIYNQLIEKYGQQLGIKQPIAKPHGPLPFDKNAGFHMRPLQQQGAEPGKMMELPKNATPMPSPQALVFEYFSNDTNNSGEPTEIAAPWEGKLMGKMKLDSGENILSIAHENGLKSQINFNGTTATNLPKLGDSIAAGQKLGYLSPDSKKFYWQVK